MNRRSLLGFIVLNILVTFITVFGIISAWQRLAPPPTRLPLSPPIIVIVTSTPNPQATQVAVRIVTATPGTEGTSSSEITPGAGDGEPGSTATIDPGAIP